MRLVTADNSAQRPWLLEAGDQQRHPIKQLIFFIQYTYVCPDTPALVFSFQVKADTVVNRRHDGVLRTYFSGHTDKVKSVSG